MEIHKITLCKEKENQSVHDDSTQEMDPDWLELVRIAMQSKVTKKEFEQFLDDNINNKK